MDSFYALVFNGVLILDNLLRLVSYHLPVTYVSQVCGVFLFPKNTIYCPTLLFRHRNGTRHVLPIKESESDLSAFDGEQQQTTSLKNPLCTAFIPIRAGFWFKVRVTKPDWRVRSHGGVYKHTVENTLSFQMMYGCLKLLQNSSQISVRGCLHSVKTVIQLYKMLCGKKYLTATSLLILLIFGSYILRGHSLSCHQSEYQIGSECCPMCPPGNRVKTDCTEFRSTSCRSCEEGTFMNQNTGLKKCFLCATCDAGSGLKIKSSCTQQSDTVCEPLEGFHCIDSTDGVCIAARRHTSCLPGQYVAQKGTDLTDTVCLDCGSGTFSNGTVESCQPHTQCESLDLWLITPGTASSDNECGEQKSNPTEIIVGLILGLIF